MQASFFLQVIALKIAFLTYVPTLPNQLQKNIILGDGDSSYAECGWFETFYVQIGR